MPPTDRRRLRSSLVQKRGAAKVTAALGQGCEEPAELECTSAEPERAPAPTQPRLVGFDFDCTITVKHFYKVFAWGYLEGNPDTHPHCMDFRQWCDSRGVSPRLQGLQFDARNPMGSALDEFCRDAGDSAFRDVFREVFCGGEERICLLTDWMQRMSRAGVEFAIVTAGTSTAVVRALAVGVPEWLPFFPSNRVWDTSQGRHALRGVGAQKVLMLRDICPTASRIVFVDDAVERDCPPKWTLAGAQVEIFKGALPYEGPGINAELLDELEKQLFS